MLVIFFLFKSEHSLLFKNAKIAKHLITVFIYYWISIGMFGQAAILPTKVKDWATELIHCSPATREFLDGKYGT
jgi:hypothetical protein